MAADPHDPLLSPASRIRRALSPWPLAAASLALVTASFAVRTVLLKVRHFGPDEFQHLHRSWCVARGLLPHRDFFDHHPLGLPLLLRPLFALFQVETEIGDAFSLIFLARGFMGLLALAMVGLTFRLAWAWRGPAAAWLAAGLLATTVPFFDKSTETRPDVPAAVLALGGCLLALASVGRERSGRGSMLLALAGGLALGAAPLFTPKAAFLLLAPAAPLLTHPPHALLAARFRRIAVFGLGVVLPGALTLAYFARHHAGAAFLEGTVWINARWKGRLGPEAVLLDLMTTSPLLLPLAALGAAVVIVPVMRRRRLEPEGALLMGGLAGFLAGLLVIPTIYRQFVLLFTPLLAILAAGGLQAGAQLWHSRCRIAGTPEVTMAVALLVLGVPALAQIRRGADRDNTRTLDDMRFIHRNVAPWETVMDGFTGWAVFRPSASYYYFLHGDLRMMVPDRDIAALERDLRSGRAVPKVILFDRYLRSVSPAITAFLEENYAPVGRERIRVRLYDNGLGRWDDTGVRRLGRTAHEGDPLAEPHVVIAEGWRRIEGEGPASFRRCVGRCALLVPVRAPRSFTALVEARTADGEPARVELRVNGQPPRQAAVDGAWAVRRVVVRAAELQPGFNRFVFTCRRSEPPGSCTLAVTTLALQPEPEGPRAAASTARTSSSSIGRKSA